MPRRRSRPYESLTDWEKQLDRFVKFKLWQQGHTVFNDGEYRAPSVLTPEIHPIPNGWKKPSFHETHFGCKVWFTEVEFGIGHEGVCSTCYHEYPAVLFNWNCEALCPRGQRLHYQHELRDYAFDRGFSLPEILSELEQVK